MKGDRDLVSIERSLGLRSVRGISRQSNKDSPPIKAILDGIKVIATEYVTKSNGEIRASHALQQDAYDLLDRHGTEIWPGPEHERPPWLEEPSEYKFDGKYPRHLYFVNPDDRETLRERFYQLVVEKCCNYHDNQLQKHRRVSQKKQTGHDDSASVTPRRESDLPWFVDGGNVDGAESDDVEMGEAEAPPTNSWSAVNTQPAQQITAPPPALPSPIETPEVMPHGLPGIFEPKKEPSPALPVQNGAEDVEMSSPEQTRPESRAQRQKDFANSFLDYYIEDADGDDQSGRKRKREPVDEHEIASKRSRADDEDAEDGHQALLVKFKVNSTQFANIVNKAPRPGHFSSAFQQRPPSPARTTTSSIADGSAYQGDLGRTRGRSKLDSLKTETIIHVTQYRDKRGKWYEVDIDSRPEWATDERVVTRSIPRGRQPSSYVKRREGSSRASSVAGSITHASERRSSAVVQPSRDDHERLPQANEDESRDLREANDPEATKAPDEPSNEDHIQDQPQQAQETNIEPPPAEQTHDQPKQRSTSAELQRSEEPKEQPLGSEQPKFRATSRMQPRDGEVSSTVKPAEVSAPAELQGNRSSVQPSENASSIDRRSMPPPSQIPSQVSSVHTSPERPRVSAVVPLTTLPGSQMLSPKSTQPMHLPEHPHYHWGGMNPHHPNQGGFQPPPPPGFRPLPHAHPHQHEPPHHVHRPGPQEPPAPLFRSIYGPPPGPQPSAEPPRAQYASADAGPKRKHSIPLGVPLEIRPDVPKDQGNSNGGQARPPAASEPPPAATAPPHDQMPRWASVNVRDPVPQQVVIGARRDGKDGAALRSPGISHGEMQQLPTRRPVRDAPYAQPPQHAAAASHMQNVWNPTADNILGEFVNCQVGRQLQSQEIPRNMLAVYKEIFLEDPRTQNDFRLFTVLSEQRRQDQRYVQEAIRKHVNPFHPADAALPPPPPSSKPATEEQRIAPHPKHKVPARIQDEQQAMRFGMQPPGSAGASPVPGRERLESIPPREAVAGAQIDAAPFHGHHHMDHPHHPAPLPRPPILPSQAPKPEPPEEKLTPAPSTPIAGGGSLDNVTIEINWGRALDFSDYMPMKDCSTAKEFFELVEAQLPDELRGEGKKIKEIRAKALTDLAGGSRLPRITRDEGPGRMALRQLVKKLRSQPEGKEVELEFLVIWEGIPVTA